MIQKKDFIAEAINNFYRQQSGISLAIADDYQRSEIVTVVSITKWKILMAVFLSKKFALPNRNFIGGKDLSVHSNSLKQEFL